MTLDALHEFKSFTSILIRRYEAKLCQLTAPPLPIETECCTVATVWLSNVAVRFTG